MKIRTFLALELSDEARQGAVKLIDRLKAGIRFTGAEPNWTPPDSMHLTIKFLGNVEESQVNQIKQRLAPVCGKLASFNFGVRGLGVFPSPERPKIIWLGVKHADEELQRLFRTVEETLARLGFEHEHRPFHPHLTAARLKSGKGAKAMMKILDQNRRHWCGECRADKLILFKSVLKPSGAEYSILKEFPFQAPESS